MNDKKKLAILGALVVVMLAVGAFSFLGKSKPAPAASAEVAANEKADEEKAPATEEEGLTKTTEITGMVANHYSPRDPFEAPSGADSAPPRPAPPVQTKSRSSNNNSQPSGYVDAYRPLPLAGDLGSIGGGLPLVPTGPTYKVKGVLIGKKPVAVFEDESGNQKLVPLGGSVDGDTKVIKIEKGKVTVSHKGKTKTLALEEIANQ